MFTNALLSSTAIIAEPHFTEIKAPVVNRKAQVSLDYEPQDHRRHLAVMEYAVVVSFQRTFTDALVIERNICWPKGNRRCSLPQRYTSSTSNRQKKPRRISGRHIVCHFENICSVTNNSFKRLSTLRIFDIFPYPHSNDTLTQVWTLESMPSSGCSTSIYERSIAAEQSWCSVEYRQSHKQTDRQTDRQADRKTDMLTGHKHDTNQWFVEQNEVM